MSNAPPLQRALAKCRDPLPLALAVLLLSAAGMAQLKPLFAAAFPALDRPLYEQDSYLALLWAHVQIVGWSSAAAGHTTAWSLASYFDEPFDHSHQRSKPDALPLYS